MSKKYQGWANYPTWNVKLWIDNEESDHWWWREQALAFIDAAEATTHLTRLEVAARDLAQKLERNHNEAHQCSHAHNIGWQNDLLEWALGQVDWHEVADAYIEDAWDTDATRDD